MQTRSHMPVQPRLLDLAGTLERAVVSKKKTLLVSDGTFDAEVETRVQALKSQIDVLLAAQVPAEIHPRCTCEMQFRDAFPRCIPEIHPRFPLRAE